MDRYYWYDGQRVVWPLVPVVAIMMGIFAALGGTLLYAATNVGVVIGIGCSVMALVICFGRWGWSGGLVRFVGGFVSCFIVAATEVVAPNPVFPVVVCLLVGCIATVLLMHKEYNDVIEPRED